MESLPYELQFRLIENLPIEDILNLCKTDSKFRKLCEDSYMWKYLLKRDYQIKYNGNDPKIKYIQEYTKQKIKQKTLFTVVSRYDDTTLSILASDLGDVKRYLADQYNKGELVFSYLIDQYKEDLNLTYISSEEISDFLDTTDDIQIEESSIVIL